MNNNLFSRITMNICCKTVFIIAFLFIVSFNVQLSAQVTADFQIDKPTGCSPLIVTFTNKSIPATGLSFSWRLGNGNSSIDPNPKATYTNAQTYKITLIATNGTKTDSISKSITVYKNPTANFTAVQKGCAPLNAKFNASSSVPGSAAITKYVWDLRFGSSDTFTTTNYNYTYTGAGKYGVFLQVIDANGCVGSIDKPNFIDVGAKPEASFIATPPSSCKVPVNVSFNNLSTGGGNLTYNWDFGDNTKSTDKNPSHTFTSFNVYTIKLGVSSDYGCSASRELLYYVDQINAKGTIKQNTRLLTAKDTVCLGSIDFENLSTGSPFVKWEFGDGLTSSEQKGTHSYASPGNFKVLLISSPGNSCADTVTWKINVEKALANFVMDKEYSCLSQVVVNFTDKSTNAVKWKWAFQNGNTSTQKNPSTTYKIPLGSDPYASDDPYFFTTTLEISSRHGCVSTVSDVFRIKRPTAKFVVNKTEGCAPLSVTFKDNSLSEEKITSRKWIFGDGAFLAGNDSFPTHVYNTTNRYRAALVITNRSGCSDTSIYQTIKSARIPKPKFSVSLVDACSNTFAFTNLTAKTDSVTTWHYTTDNNTVYGCSNATSATHSFMNETGSVDVKLTVGANGCYADTTLKQIALVENPIAGFTWRMTCNNPLDYKFKNKSKNYDSFKWLFPTGAVVNNVQETAFSFPSEGNHQVKLIAIKGGCTDTFSVVLKVRIPNPNFNVDPIVCANQPAKFDGGNSFAFAAACGDRYQWNFNDNKPGITTSSDTINHIFTKRGTYNVVMKAIYENGCTASTSKNVRVYQPIASFMADDTMGCSPLKVKFTDKSTADLHALKEWSWDFGDGKDTSHMVPVTNITHWYTNPGVFAATLTLVDIKGCIGRASKTISTANPDATFLPLTNTAICAGNDVSFTYFYNNADSVQWNFGDGKTISTLAKPAVHKFTKGGVYDVSATVYKFGCSDVSKLEQLIQVQEPDASFTLSDSVTSCYPEQITFTHNPAGQVIVSGKWSFGYGNQDYPEYASSRVFTYPSPGLYKVSLEIQTSNGCTSKFSRNVTIKGPAGSFIVLPKSSCIGDVTTFTLKDTADLFDYAWDLGDGTFAKGSPFKHRYDRTGRVIAQLVLYGDSGRCIPPPVKDSIDIIELKAEFSLEDTIVCAQTQVNFENISIGAEQLSWDFGNGTNSTEISPAKEFEAGNFKINLIVWNTIGCRDTFSQSLLVHKLPGIIALGDTLICFGGNALLVASGGDKIKWNPINGLNNPTSYSPFASPQETTIYTAIVTDTVTLCDNSQDVMIQVQQIPQINISPDDTSVIIGEFVPVTVFTDEKNSIEWFPATDISCTDCFNPIIRTFEPTVYTITVKDPNHCFVVEKEFQVNIRKVYSVDVPSAFTPNGDGVNDVILVRGWGIKELLEFKIFNRWGNLVFSSTDLAKGWDGKMNGNDQPIDTYVYMVAVKTWDGNILTKKGNINLLR